jgi:hypothetical protein
MYSMTARETWELSGCRISDVIEDVRSGRVKVTAPEEESLMPSGPDDVADAGLPIVVSLSREAA